MPLYLVSRTDRVGWDEYDEVVVRAGSKAAALRLVLNPPEDSCPSAFYGFEPDGSNAVAERIELRGPSAVISASFNAG
ncbi:hypothetical protein ACFV1L_10410 [Kitasatospora sp. NPDC059646]|uniref:hypothetical protein n=1 Tax=Kitasatospora sp. NPDC059646 TaxID=3346893 RepID=UPI003687CCA5